MGGAAAPGTMHPWPRPEKEGAASATLAGNSCSHQKNPESGLVCVGKMAAKGSESSCLWQGGLDEV